MYRLFVKNLDGFKKAFAKDIRLDMAKPLYLLHDIEEFNRHKAKLTQEYIDLSFIIKQAEILKTSVKHHGFGMFLTELYLQRFDFEPLPFDGRSPDETPKPDNATLDYQVSLLHQFMFPAY